MPKSMKRGPSASGRLRMAARFSAVSTTMRSSLAGPRASSGLLVGHRTTRVSRVQLGPGGAVQLGQQHLAPPRG